MREDIFDVTLVLAHYHLDLVMQDDNLYVEVQFLTYFRKKGFYGEGLPEDSQIVLTIKTHGHTTGDGARVQRDQQHFYNHMKEVRIYLRRAIILFYQSTLFEPPIIVNN